MLFLESGEPLLPVMAVACASLITTSAHKSGSEGLFQPVIKERLQYVPWSLGRWLDRSSQIANEDC